MRTRDMVAGSRRRHRRAFTLTETLVALSLGSMLMVVLYSIFGVGVRNYERSEKQSESFLSALLVLEALERDVARLTIDGKRAGEPVVIDEEGPGLTLHLARSDPADLLRVYDAVVHYDLLHVKGGSVLQLRRNGSVIKGSYLRKLRFEWIPQTAPEAHGVGFLRVSFEATDRRGGQGLAVVRLFCPDVPTLLWRERKGGGRGL